MRHMRCDKRSAGTMARRLRGLLGAGLCGAIIGGMGAGLVAADEPASAPDLQLRYAEARLKLADLNLERAREANRQTSGSVGPREIARLENFVRLARRQVEIARQRPRTTVNQTNLAAAEIAVEDARADLDAAVRANEHAAGSITRLNIERLEAKLQIAELHLELLRQPAYVPSLIDEMQWHIDQLTNQVIDLRHQISTHGTGDAGWKK